MRAEGWGTKWRVQKEGREKGRGIGVVAVEGELGDPPHRRQHATREGGQSVAAYETVEGKVWGRWKI
jgi:hypothetical protein